MALSDKWFNAAKTVQEALVVLQSSAPHISGAATRAKSLLVLNNAILATDRDSEAVQLATIAAAKPSLMATRDFMQGPLKTSLQALLAEVDQASSTIDNLLNDDVQ